MCGGAKKIVCVVSGGGIDSGALVHILQGMEIAKPRTDKKCRFERNVDLRVGSTKSVIANLLIQDTAERVEVFFLRRFRLSNGSQ